MSNEDYLKKVCEILGADFEECRETARQMAATGYYSYSEAAGLMAARLVHTPPGPMKRLRKAGWWELLRATRLYALADKILSSAWLRYSAYIAWVAWLLMSLAYIVYLLAGWGR